jgi:hypothetical protein
MNTENTYAVIENGLVENIIVADSLDLAIEISGKECVYISEEHKQGRIIYIGCEYDGQHFIEEQPYPSWTLNSVSKIWEPPTPRPDDYETIVDSEIILYRWDEETLSWLRHEQPVNVIQ